MKMRYDVIVHMPHVQMGTIFDNVDDATLWAIKHLLSGLKVTIVPYDQDRIDAESND